MINFTLQNLIFQKNSLCPIFCPHQYVWLIIFVDRLVGINNCHVSYSNRPLKQPAIFSIQYSCSFGNFNMKTIPKIKNIYG